MGKNIEFTDKELEMLHAIVVKEKSGLEHMNHGTIFGKESLDNYFKDLSDLQLKIEDAKKEKIEILIVANTVNQAKMKSMEFIKKLDGKIRNFELEKSKIIYVNSDNPIGLKVGLNKISNIIKIEVENEDVIKQIRIRFNGSQQLFDGMRFDAAVIDYPTFYGKNLIYNESAAEKVYELEQKLKYTLIKSKYYEKELPELVKWLLD